MNGITGLINTPYTNIAGESAHRSSARSEIAQLKRVANGSGTAESAQSRKTASYGASSIISASQSFAQSVRESRLKTKETSNEVKKLRYNYKDISSQIMRSKTSQSAKQVASKARREVLRLRRAKAGGQYDEEEVDAALEHAKSMERVAKKKAAHLQQEELIHITDDPSMRESVRELEEHPEKLGEEEKDILDELTDHSSESEDAGSTVNESISAEQQMQMEELMQSMSDLMSDMSEELSEELEDLELLTELTAAPKEMNEADYKKLVTKHRTDEMKEMAEADKEYLKFIFEKYQKMKGSASMGSGSTMTPSASPAPHISSADTVSAASLVNMAMSSTGFDVSV